MSHSTFTKKTVFIHNGDYSGDITIKKKDGEEFEIDSDELFSFFAKYLKSKRQQYIDDLEDSEILEEAIKGSSEREVRDLPTPLRKK